MPQSALRAQNPEAATSLIIEPRRIHGQEPFFDLSLQDPGADSPLVCALAVSPRAVVEALAVFLGNAFDLDIGKLDELICSACREDT